MPEYRAVALFSSHTGNDLANLLIYDCIYGPKGEKEIYANRIMSDNLCDKADKPTTDGTSYQPNETGGWDGIIELMIDRRTVALHLEIGQLLERIESRLGSIYLYLHSDAYFSVILIYVFTYELISAKQVCCPCGFL